ncbi:MAG: EAL domain-containing protein [Proteobacteria bacterium]|nr:EAL domain-containing protein [Pseudomonadota bacterium]
MAATKRLTNILLATGAIALGGLALAGAFLGTGALKESNQTRWRDELAEEAPKRASDVADWLNDKLKISDRLTNDRRISGALQEIMKNPDLLVVDPAVDQALKEFGVAPEGSLDAYVFDNDSRLVSTGLKSRDIPLHVRKALAQAYNTGLNSYITLQQIDGQTYLLVTQRVIAGGASLGYVGYMHEARSAFSALNTHMFDNSDLRQLIARRSGDKDVIVVSWPKGSFGAVVRSQNAMGIDAPLFAAVAPVFGVYHDENAKQVYVYIENIPGHPLWQTALYIDLKAAQATIERSAMIMKGVASAFAFMMFLVAIGLLRRAFGNAKAPLMPSREGMSKAANVFRSGFRNYGKASKIFGPVTTRNLNLQGAARPADDLPQAPASRGDALPETAEDVLPDEDQEDKKPEFTGMDKLSRPVSEMDKDDPELVARGNMISQCLEDERIRLYFQPIIDTATNKKVMYETLLRVVDPEGNILMPGDVIPVAIKRGFIQQIDDTVIVASIRRHMEIFTQGKRAMLSINLSYGAFSSMKFMEVFMEGMSKGQIRPEYLNFELASREIIEDQKAMGFIKEMRDMGCKFSVDYFGGGVKTVEAAKQLKFDYMKVDCLKFRGISDGNAQHITEFREVMLRGQELGIKMIAEKIEDKPIWWLCKRLNVPYMQGFYLAEPTPKLDLGW